MQQWYLLVLTTQCCSYAAKGNLSMPWCVTNKLSLILLCILLCKNSHKKTEFTATWRVILRSLWCIGQKKSVGKFDWFFKLILTLPTLLLIYQNQHIENLWFHCEGCEVMSNYKWSFRNGKNKHSYHVTEKRPILDCLRVW